MNIFSSKQAATWVHAIVIAYSVVLKFLHESNRESSEQSCFSEGKKIIHEYVSIKNK